MRASTAARLRSFTRVDAASYYEMMISPFAACVILSLIEMPIFECPALFERGVPRHSRVVPFVCQYVTRR